MYFSLFEVLMQINTPNTPWNSWQQTKARHLQSLLTKTNFSGDKWQLWQWMGLLCANLQMQPVNLLVKSSYVTLVLMLPEMHVIINNKKRRSI